MSDSGIAAEHKRTELSHEVRWNFRVLDEMPMSRYLVEVAKLNATHVRYENWSTALDESGVDLAYGLGTVLMVQRDPQGLQAAIRIDETVALVRTSFGSLACQVAGTSSEQVDATVSRIAAAFDATDANTDSTEMTFWVTGGAGTTHMPCLITVPSWTEIRHNYALDVAEEVEQLLKAREPETGRLILWHGPAGTGKTHVIRALAREWSPWCSTHVITDPELLLRDRPSYIVDVILHSDRSKASRGRRWKLIVLEDSGELLSSDARRQTGQALSRLLNVTDGILGQGMRAIVLVTTNEPLGKLHPAVRRPGRCLSEIEFVPLDALTANKWLAAHDTESRVESPTTLADLYARTRGEEAPLAQAFGFAAGA